MNSYLYKDISKELELQSQQRVTSLIEFAVDVFPTAAKAWAVCIFKFHSVEKVERTKTFRFNQSWETVLNLITNTRLLSLVRDY